MRLNAIFQQSIGGGQTVRLCTSMNVIKWLLTRPGPKYKEVDPRVKVATYRLARVGCRLGSVRSFCRLSQSRWRPQWCTMRWTLQPVIDWNDSWWSRYNDAPISYLCRRSFIDRDFNSSPGLLYVSERCRLRHLWRLRSRPRLTVALIIVSALNYEV